MLYFRAQKEFVGHQFVFLAVVFRGVEAVLDDAVAGTELFEVERAVEVVEHPQVAFLEMFVHEEVNIVAKDDVRDFGNFAEAVFVPVVGGLIGVDADFGEVGDVAVDGFDAVAREDTGFDEIAGAFDEHCPFAGIGNIGKVGMIEDIEMPERSYLCSAFRAMMLPLILNGRLASKRVTMIVPVPT